MEEEKRVILDTNILLGIFKKEEKTLEIIEKLIEQKKIFLISSISLYEYYRGAYTNQELIKTKLLHLSRIIAKLKIEVIGFDDKIAQCCAIIYAKMKENNVPNLSQKELDILIGGTSSTMEYQLVTHNKSDFTHIPEINLFN